jgi:hypothetical protein
MKSIFKKKKTSGEGATDTAALTPPATPGVTAMESSYQSLPDANMSSNNHVNHINLHRGDAKYKGFNTSITHFCFHDESSRVDCCSLVCCGLLQSDYNQYILHNKRPPTFTNRFIMHILVPIVFFCLAGYAAVMVQDENLKQIIVWMMLTIMIGWIFGGVFKSNYKQGIVRRDLLRKVRAINSGVVVDSLDEM